MNDMKKIQVGLADDNQDFCNAVKEFICKQDNMEILFIACDGLETLEN